MPAKISEITSKTVLTQTSLPGADFVVNSYSGCAFGCVYCYADFTRKFQGHLKDKWGEYVDVRMNAAEVFEKELKSLIKQISNKPKTFWKNKKYPIILLSSVCDPYQGAEANYKITRMILEKCVEYDFPGQISILTKSPLVTRDIDLLKELKHVDIGITITSTDDKVSKLFEKDAPPASVRLKTLKKLSYEGLNTYVCVSPLLPHFVEKEEKLGELLTHIKRAGAKYIFIEHINLSGNKMNRILQEISDKVDNEIIERIYTSQTAEYKAKLEEIILRITKEMNLPIWGGGVIDHEEIMGKTKFIFKK